MLRQRLLHAVHQPLDQRRDQEQQHAGTNQHPESEGVARVRRFHGHAGFTADAAGEQTGQAVANRGGQEPATHAEANQAHRCQLGHHR